MCFDHTISFNHNVYNANLQTIYCYDKSGMIKKYVSHTKNIMIYGNLQKST